MVGWTITGPIMDPLSLLALLRARRVLRSHQHWTRGQMLAHQNKALAELRAHAYAHSPFYAEFHAGLEHAPLGDLPVLTKAALMDNFDSLVTDRAVTLEAVEQHLERAAVTDRFLGRYRVAATGGTSGRRGILLADPGEWTAILASYARAYDWVGLQVGITHPLRMAIVSSRAPSHQSSIVGATVRNPFVPTLRLDATDALATTVSALNAFRPQALVGYASVLRDLAAEQAAGRLAISPRAVFSASEVLTPEARSAASAAWGSQPFNVYAATETAGIASECQQRHLHRYEDVVIAEPVDEQNRPVPPGVTGEKLLVTVLFSRTQPLIRYELTDRVRFSVESADDVGPFGLLDEVEGRSEDIITLPGASGGEVRIHPNVFHAVLERTDAPWQVIRYPDRLHILVGGPADIAHLRASLGHALAGAGAAPQAIEVERVTAIPRTSLGKAPLVRVVTTSPD